jgi:hypothetical protein
MNFHDVFGRAQTVTSPRSEVWVDSNIQFATVSYTNVNWSDSHNHTLLTGEGVEFEFRDGLKLEVSASENIYADECPDPLDAIQANLLVASIRLYEDYELVHDSKLYTG